MKEILQAVFESMVSPLRRRILIPPVAFVLLASACTGADTFLPPDLPGNKPWTDQAFRNDARDFQFVIMSDRTGGMQPGVFAEAVRKVNLLQPEFVMSIGDLIDGYTEDEGLVREQWEEFDAIVRQLEMPFFYLPGNHDISNVSMHRQWQERLGPAYYHFVYGNVLFLCLNTEPHCRIDDEQVASFRKAIDENPEVRWTFIFLHRPLWAYGQQGGLEKITGHLDQRPFTVFSGHDHAYRKSERDGNTYITLATTGGGGPMRGPELGEADHVTWVTMTDDGPRIANLLLEGVYDENMVDDESFPMVTSLRHGGWLSTKPIVHETDQFDRLTAEVHLVNHAPLPMHVRGGMTPQDGLRFEPAELDVVVGPSESRSIPITLLGGADTSIARLEPVRIELTATYERDGKPPLAASATREILTDWRHAIEEASRPIQVDGRLDDWPEGRLLDCDQPQYVKEDWAWGGLKDGWFRFGTAWDADYLYVAVESIDDRLLFQEGEQADRQDQFTVTLDARAASVRATAGDTSPDHAALSVVLAPGLSGKTLPRSGHKYDAACRAGDTGFTAELAIPHAYLDEVQGGSWRDVRLNLAFMDHDNPQNTKPSVLWWRPPWSGRGDYAGSGTFARE